MTQKIQTIFSKRVIAMVAIFAFAIVTVSSCTKSKSDPANKQFIGTYNGNDCAGNSATITVNAGGSDNTISLPSSISGGTSCSKGINVVGTISGNTVAFASQTFTDNCGNSATLSGSGGISGSTITLNLTATETVSGTTTTVSSCFTGTR